MLEGAGEDTGSDEELLLGVAEVGRVQVKLGQSGCCQFQVMSDGARSRAAGARYHCTAIVRRNSSDCRALFLASRPRPAQHANKTSRTATMRQGLVRK